MTASKPTCSHRVTISFVFNEMPPRYPFVGEGRTNALISRDKWSIRVLSPSIEPPERALEGSIANTATFRLFVYQIHTNFFDK